MDNLLKNTSLPLEDFWGSGWSFPIVFDSANNQLSTTEKIVNINESINIILKTNRGERCMNPEFGGGLDQFLFRTMDETLKGEIIDSTKYALINYEPRITVSTIDVQFVDPSEGLIYIEIDYIVNKTNTRHNYVFPFYLKEGTNL